MLLGRSEDTPHFLQSTGDSFKEDGIQGKERRGTDSQVRRYQFSNHLSETGAAMGLLPKGMFRAVYRCPINWSLPQSLPVQEVQSIEQQKLQTLTYQWVLPTELCVWSFSSCCERILDRNNSTRRKKDYLFSYGLRWYRGGQDTVMGLPKVTVQEQVTAVSYMVQRGARDLSVPEPESDRNLNSCPTTHICPLHPMSETFHSLP